MSKNFRISAIICELNPPHNGHISLFRQLRDASDGYLIAVMSGNYVQRGTPAVFDKWTRTRAALRGGVDLVIELPLPWAVSGAQRFAEGGVALLDALHCVDTLGFGSECGQLEPLQTLADTFSSSRFQEVLRQVRAGDNTSSFAAVRQQAAAALVGEKTAALLSQPNNILGISYCQALAKFRSSIQPVTVRRLGAGYNDDTPNAACQFPSAAQLRALLQADSRCDLSPYLPSECNEVLQAAAASGDGPVFPAALETAILARLRTMTPEQLAKLPDVSEGLDRRLYQGIRTAVTLEQLYETVKVKRYSHARIRRLVLSAFLGIAESDGAGLPPYCRILGMSRRGTKLLPHLSKHASIPFLVKYSDSKTLDSHGKRIFDLECQADDLYALASPNPRPCGSNMTTGIITE